MFYVRGRFRVGDKKYCLVSIKVTKSNVCVCVCVCVCESCFAAYFLEMVLLYWCGGFVLCTFEYVYIVQ